MSPSSLSASTNPPAIRSRLRRYAFALILVAIAALLRTLLDPVMGQQGAGIFLVAILLGGWVGGVGPAITCLVVLHVIHAYWFAVPRGLWQPNMASVVSTSAYYLVG